MTRFAVLLALVLTICITGSSAFIRHSQSGVGCADRAACVTSAADEPAPAVRMARLLHRVSAMLVGLLAGAIALVGWSGLRGGERGAALVALAVTGGLAWLGRYTPHDLPLVTLGNVLGGFVLAAAFAWIAAPAWRDATAPSGRGLSGLLAVALLFALVQAGLGVMLSVRHAVDACASVACWPDGAPDWRVLDPLAAGIAESASAARLLHLVHRLCALALTLVCLLTLVGGHATLPGRARGAILALLLTQGLLGVATAFGWSALAAATAHNVVAAMLIVALALSAGALLKTKAPATG